MPAAITEAEAAVVVWGRVAEVLEPTTMLWGRRVATPPPPVFVAEGRIGAEEELGMTGRRVCGAVGVVAAVVGVALAGFHAAVLAGGVIGAGATLWGRRATGWCSTP